MASFYKLKENIILYIAILITFMIYNVAEDQKKANVPVDSGHCLNIVLYSIHYWDYIHFINLWDYQYPSNSENIEVPILLWWTPFTKQPGEYRKCGNVKCFMTNDRKYSSHKNLETFIFYGTDIDIYDLPFPREHNHTWSLLHEESPHNQWMLSHEEGLSLFNFTSTFRRESDFPITTQWLDSVSKLQSKEYFLSFKEKSKLQKEKGHALVNFVQSDCNPSSDRDTIVKKLQKYMEVDSYGKCLHNKDLPMHLRNSLQTMGHDDFYHLISEYKFTFAMENAICDDYVTEKIWRPLIAGSIPIVWGSPKIKDLLPDNHSAIFLKDFKNIKEVVDLLEFLDKDEKEYNKYFEFKNKGIANENLLKIMKERKWSVGDELIHGNRNSFHYVQGFECFLCKELHKMKNNKKMKPKTATLNHYGCQKPMKFEIDPPDSLKLVNDTNWASAWQTAKFMAVSLQKFITNKVYNYTKTEFMEDVIEEFKKAKLW